MLSGGGSSGSSGLPTSSGGGLPVSSGQGLPMSSGKASQWRSMEQQPGSTTIKVKARTAVVSRWINGSRTRISDYLRLQGIIKWTIVEAKGSNVTHQSLDQRFSGKDRQLPMTASHHLWSMVKAQDSGVDRPSLDQRFSHTEDHSSGSTILRHGVARHSVDLWSTTRMVSHWSLHVKHRLLSLRQQDKDKQCHLSLDRWTATDNRLHQVTVQGQTTSVTGLRSNHNICRSKQQRITDKAGKSITDARTL